MATTDTEKKGFALNSEWAFRQRVATKSRETLLLYISTLTKAMMGTAPVGIEPLVYGYTVGERLKMYAEELERRDGNAQP